MKYGLWLSNIPGIGAAKIHSLMTAFGSAADVYGAGESGLKCIYGITGDDAARIMESKRTWNLEREFVRLMEQGISFITEEQEDFPERLRRIHNPPYSIYYRGRLPDPEKKAVAIVGARGRSAYGSQIARQLAKELALHDVEIISGLARGIDSDGHIGALDGGGSTYAVLGCGVDICYPRQNQYLYHQILERGGILSEYPPGQEPAARLFPARNRIISALSDCVAVVEARLKSGSLITADYAMEQGKDVYALPGRITDPLSSGCNHLISQGAGIIENVENFLEELHMITENSPVQMDFRKNLLEKDEGLVYSLLDFCPVGLGKLSEKTAWELPVLLDVLSRLEQKGFVRENVPNFYIKCI